VRKRAIYKDEIGRFNTVSGAALLASGVGIGFFGSRISQIVALLNKIPK